MRHIVCRHSIHTELLRAVILSENHYKKGVRPAHAWDQLIRGTYVAFCEGDDYWFDPYKLQEQIAFLEANPDVAVVSGGFISTNVHSGSIEEIVIQPNGVAMSEHGYFFTLDDTLDVWLTKLLSLVHRAEARRNIPRNGSNFSGDVHVFYHLLKRGRGYYMAKPLGVYRIHQGGAYSMLDSMVKLQRNFQVYWELYSRYRDEYSRVLALRHALMILGYRPSADEAITSVSHRSKILRKKMKLVRTPAEIVRFVKVALSDRFKLR